MPCGGWASASGSSVLVIGGGPIGQSVVLAARMEGATDIVVSEIDPGRRALCERFGAKVLDPAGGPLPSRSRQSSAARPRWRSTRSASSRRSRRRSNRCSWAVRCAWSAWARRSSRSTHTGSAPRSVRWSAVSPTRRRISATRQRGCRADPPRSGELISRQVPLDDGPHAFADLAAATAPRARFWSARDRADGR